MLRFFKSPEVPKENIVRKGKAFLNEERYLRTEGQVHLTGIQALVRLPFDNLRLLKKIFPDKTFAYFISGYEGSPLGGLDINLKNIYPLLKKWNIFHVPGGNEEAAANMVWGSQLHRLYGPSKVDGVIGAWYGKGPGVRRVSDVSDHMQMAGLDKFCAAYFMSGDDHTSKSSTTPHQTELVHLANHVPTAYPGNIQEILEVGKKATLASMLTGLAINLKLETFVCDGSQEFILDPEEDMELVELFREFLKDHDDYKRHFSPILLKPKVLENEQELMYSKLPMMQEVSRYFGFDNWHNRHLKSDFGIVATGKSYYDLLGALQQLGIDENEIEIYKPLLIWPIDTQSLKEFARGKKEIIVVEEKRAFYESHMKSAFFNDTERPLIIGKNDEFGNILFRQNNNLDADLIRGVLGKRLVTKKQFKDRKMEEIIKEREERVSNLSSIETRRPPEYCSGCQHRTALEVPGYNNLEGTVESIMMESHDLEGNPVKVEITPKHVMGIGIGCSTMSIIDSLPSNRAVVVGPMGSEGMLWMGASTFSFRVHAHQGCGYGTFFHSAENNIRFIKDSIQHLQTHFNVNDISQTLLIVDNSVVAMTGGQRPVGQFDAEAAIANIRKEGIENLALVAEFPEQYKPLEKKYGISVYHKSETLRVKEMFAEKPGLSVIWYVEKCGLEKGRERKRSPDLAPKVRVHVNTDVCDNCGDCGQEAKCASVWQTDTIFGPKVKIHQYSCIQDFACAKGECPSYVKIYTRSGSPLKKPDLVKIAIHDDEFVDPLRTISKDKIHDIYSIGIGGWGLMTAYEILARAATREGKHVVKEDDTGLSQKGGEVRNSLKISQKENRLNEGFKIEVGGADFYISSDLIGAVNPENLKATSPKLTKAIINTEKIPTMPMIVGKDTFPDTDELISIIDRHTVKEKNIYVNATGIVESLFKDFRPTNIFMLGVAFQGMEDFPIDHASSIEEGIVTNNIEVEKNIQAFRYGRMYVLDPQRVLSLAFPKKPTVDENLESFNRQLPFASRNLFEVLVQRLQFAGTFQEKFHREIFELFKFQNGAYAKQFVDFVEQVHSAERIKIPHSDFRFTKMVADNLYDLMAYKDEYRVADLLTRPDAIQSLVEDYEDGEIKKIRFLLRPPILEHIPWIKNLSYIKEKFAKDGKWEFPGWMLGVLKHFKFLRGSRLDFLAWKNETRNQERKAANIYEQRIDKLLGFIDEKNYPDACEAASYPGLATGYENVKQIHTKQAEDLWRRKIVKIERDRLRAEAPVDSPTKPIKVSF